MPQLHIHKGRRMPYWIVSHRGLRYQWTNENYFIWHLDACTVTIAVTKRTGKQCPVEYTSN